MNDMRKLMEAASSLNKANNIVGRASSFSIDWAHFRQVTANPNISGCIASFVISGYINISVDHPRNSGEYIEIPMELHDDQDTIHLCRNSASDEFYVPELQIDVEVDDYVYVSGGWPTNTIKITGVHADSMPATFNVLVNYIFSSCQVFVEENAAIYYEEPDTE